MARACREPSPATGNATVPTGRTSWAAAPRPRRPPATPSTSAVATGAASRCSGAATANATVATGATRSPSCAGPPALPAPAPPCSSPAAPASASTAGGAATGPPTVATAPTRRGVVRALGGTGRGWDGLGGAKVGGAATGPATVATAPTRRDVVRALGGAGRHWDVRAVAAPLTPPRPSPAAPPPCPLGQLRCRDGRCIPGARACDGTPDCRDGDDEEECPDAPSCAPPHWFRCRSGECIAIGQVCDARRHCRDWSDEPLKECGVNECLAGGGGCSHGCRDLRVGFECLCPPGFSLDPDNRTCHGPPGTLLVSTRHQVLALGGPEPQILRGPIKHAAALDVSIEGGSLFWGDPSEGLIYRAPLAAGPAVPLGVVPGPGSPAGIALDWIHRLLYWTEPGSGCVAVSDPSGLRHRTLHRDPRTRPWGVVVDPLNGYLYWSDWGSRPHIAQGAQDGAPPKPLVTEDVERPQGLALDQSSQRLYWADGRLHTVSSVALDGSGRQTHLRDPQHLAQPLGLAVFQDWAFWTDPSRGSLVATRLQGGSSAPQVVAQELFSPEAVVVLHPGRQPAGPNRCEGPGGACSFLCLPSPIRGPGSPRFSCACPDGEHLDSDGRTCVIEHPGTPEPLARNSSKEGNASIGDLGGTRGAWPGLTALGVLLPLGLVLCLGVAARALWREWRRRSTNSISFTNATFRKGPGDPLDGGGLGDPLQPLTSEDDEP
uniref:Uncharacterized protein n=1 Tax=Corvus moneduloides TaxID=1196302 RepID=A0A8U7NQK8_CORMO